MTTYEQIEGLPKDDIKTIRETAYSLHEATAGVIDTPMSPQDYEREAETRNAMELKIEDCIGVLTNQVNDLRAVQRDLKSLAGWLGSDVKRLTSLKFDGIRREKNPN